MSVEQFNLAEGQLAARKQLITVGEWNEYEVLATEPDDWASNYTNYYEKSDAVYIKLTGDTAPTFTAGKYYKANIVREFLGTRTEDSSIEFNPDMSTSTDIRGNNYTDFNKTQPQQGFDPFMILGGGKLAALLHDIMFRNALTELNQFTMYIIAGYLGNSDKGYKAQKQTGCTISYDSLGGDTKVNFPITVYFSNKSTPGTVDKLGEDFEFTPDATV